MHFTPSRLLPLLVSFALACSSSEPGVTGAGETAATSPDSGQTQAMVQPWKATSAHIVLDMMPAFRVSSRFEAARDTLREEQREALTNLRQSEGSGSVPNCGDCDSYVLAITDADGSVARYSTQPFPEALPPIDALVDEASLQALLGTFDCFESAFNPFGTEHDTAAQEWQTAPVLSSLDAPCSHGILHYSCEEMKFWLTLEAPGSYRISAEDCERVPDLSIELLDADMALLASAASTVSGCPVIAHEFAEAGTYALRSSRSRTGACEAPQSAYYRLKVSEAGP